MIELYASYQPATTRKLGGGDKKRFPEGWGVFHRNSGRAAEGSRDLDATVVYPTREAAEAEIPGILADIEQRAAARKAPQVPSSPARQAETAYTEVRSSVYGTGRRYRDQPGATQYDDGSGRYGVQIWDNA